MADNYAGFQSEGVFTPDNLIVENERAEKLIVKSGAGVLARGTVLGKVTADGKFLKSLSAASDGSQTPDAVLLDDVDATSADVEAAILLAGTVNGSALTIGTGHTLATVKAAFRSRDLYVNSAVAF